MVGLDFDWDERKSRSNAKKHGISFEEAQTVRIISARKADKREEKGYWR